MPSGKSTLLVWELLIGPECDPTFQAAKRIIALEAWKTSRRQQLTEDLGNGVHWMRSSTHTHYRPVRKAKFWRRSTKTLQTFLSQQEKEQRSGQRAKMAENFSAELYCEHFRVISDFCAMLLNFAKADIRPILKDNMKMRAINYLISELLHEVESDSRRKFYHLICEQMALTMPIYKILKLVVRQHTPEMENRKNGGLARWKSKQ
jgi:hypothetical protein